MKDAFGNDLNIGDKVIYSVLTWTTLYRVGEITKFHEHNRVTVKVKKANDTTHHVTRDPIVNSNNVVLISSLGDML